MKNLLDLVVAVFIITTNVFLGPKNVVKDNSLERRSEISIRSIKNEPDLKRVIFIFHKEKVRNISKIVSSKNIKYAKILGKLKWETLPVSYGINSDMYFGEIQRAFDECNSQLSTNLFAQPDSIINNSFIRDGFNTILWQPLSSFFGANAIAVTQLVYNSRRMTILEFDIAFNSDLAWGAGADNTFDVYDVAMHELKQIIPLIDLRKKYII